jgi:hypothetical protein
LNGISVKTDVPEGATHWQIEGDYSEGYIKDLNEDENTCRWWYKGEWISNCGYDVDCIEPL